MNLSQQLAIAIGWSPNQFIEPEKAISDNVKIMCDDGVIRHFSIKDKNLMWKLAERYNAFPWKCVKGWCITIDLVGDYRQEIFNTPEEAVIDCILYKEDK